MIKLGSNEKEGAEEQILADMEHFSKCLGVVVTIVKKFYEENKL